jgi:hypothetical protein
MFKRSIEVTLALSLALGVRTAEAFFDPPWVTPAAPRVGDVVSVNIHGGICDAIFQWPGYPQITQHGNSIHVVEYGQHWETVDLCVFGTGQLVEPIGSFPPGDYVVTVDLNYEDFLYGPSTLNIGTVPFTVTGAAPVVPVPTFGVQGRFVAVVFTFALGIWALRTRRRSRC